MFNSQSLISYAEKLYKAEPHKFGFAFWKYRELIKSAEVFKESLNGVSHYYAVNKNRLVYYWSDDNVVVIPKDELLEYDLIYIHSRYSDCVSFLDETHEIHPTNALILEKSKVKQQDVSGFYTSAFDFSNEQDFIDASDVISKSDKSERIHFSSEQIKKLTLQPVFNKNLWYFIKENKTAKPVAIGICVYDKEIKETELEWIYVRSDYQGMGIGRMLINEIVYVASSKSDIIRVGGVADGFYKKCGFTRETDKWLWIKKNGTKVGWWK